MLQGARSLSSSTATSNRGNSSGGPRRKLRQIERRKVPLPHGVGTRGWMPPRRLVAAAPLRSRGCVGFGCRRGRSWHGVWTCGRMPPRRLVVAAPPGSQAWARGRRVTVNHYPVARFFAAGLLEVQQRQGAHLCAPRRPARACEQPWGRTAATPRRVRSVHAVHGGVGALRCARGKGAALSTFAAACDAV